MVRNRIAALVAVVALLSGNALFSAQCQGGACKRGVVRKSTGARKVTGKRTAKRSSAKSGSKLAMPAQPTGFLKQSDVLQSWRTYLSDNKMSQSDFGKLSEAKQLAKWKEFIMQKVGVQRGKSLSNSQILTLRNIYNDALSGNAYDYSQVVIDVINTDNSKSKLVRMLQSQLDSERKQGLIKIGVSSQEEFEVAEPVTAEEELVGPEEEEFQPGMSTASAPAETI